MQQERLIMFTCLPVFKVYKLQSSLWVCLWCCDVIRRITQRHHIYKLCHFILVNSAPLYFFSFPSSLWIWDAWMRSTNDMIWLFLSRSSCFKEIYIYSIWINKNSMFFFLWTKICQESTSALKYFLFIYLDLFFLPFTQLWWISAGLLLFYSVHLFLVLSIHDILSVVWKHQIWKLYIPVESSEQHSLLTLFKFKFSLHLWVGWFWFVICYSLFSFIHFSNTL